MYKQLASELEFLCKAKDLLHHFIMKERISYTVVLLLCAAILVQSKAAKTVKVVSGKDLEKAGVDKMDLENYKNSKFSYFDNMPPFVSNLCTLYYLWPECLDDMFGDDVDMTSMAEQVCP